MNVGFTFVPELVTVWPINSTCTFAVLSFSKRTVVSADI